MALVLTRKIAQAICIGDEITVTVLDVDGQRVKLGVTAPREVPVYRDELGPATRSWPKLDAETLAEFARQADGMSIDEAVRLLRRLAGGL
jgi:carbon storage regulator